MAGPVRGGPTERGPSNAPKVQPKLCLTGMSAAGPQHDPPGLRIYEVIEACDAPPLNLHAYSPAATRSTRVQQTQRLLRSTAARTVDQLWNAPQSIPAAMRVEPMIAAMRGSHLAWRTSGMGAMRKVDVPTGPERKGADYPPPAVGRYGRAR